MNMGMLSGLIHSKDTMNEVARSSSLLREMDPETTRRLQQTLLEMYRDVSAVCRRHGIPLYMVGGSALGAVRHKGFIPWDDDLDLSMTRADFERFAAVFDDELSDRYLLNAPNVSRTPAHKFPRIFKRDSYYRSVIDAGDEELRRIYLDVFLLENTPDNALLRRLKGAWCNFLSVMSWDVFIREHMTDEARAFLKSGGAYNYYARMALGTLFSFRSSAAWFNTFDRAIRHGNDQSRCCCLATGRKRYFGEILPREVWMPGVTATFEGETVLLFADPDRYLKNLYGDYMVIPPPEKRERHRICDIGFSRERPSRERSAP